MNVQNVKDIWNSEVWRTRFTLLVLMNLAQVIGFVIWRTLIDNFSVEEAGFTGKEIGLLQSLREVPGFLAFTAILLLLYFKEQRLALISLLLLGIGVSITGFFPTVIGLLCTTVLMSIGFHYFETVNKSLTLQWLPKATAPELIGKILSYRSFASIFSLALLGAGTYFLDLSYEWLYGLCGFLIFAILYACWKLFPTFEELVPQRKALFLRKRYWLYYLLTFLDGARRQIFMVFAGFMLVEKFGFSIFLITMLYLANEMVNAYIAPKIGRYIIRFGERAALMLEYAGLFVVFTCYAFVELAWLAALLYILDHFFFALSIAQNTYFQKIADPEDMASTAGVAFTINHIAAVVIPVLLGLLWLFSPALVFLFGSAIAVASFLVASLIPRHPTKGQEFTLPMFNLSGKPA